MWTLKKLKKLIKGDFFSEIQWEKDSIQVNSRHVKYGDLYICVKGLYTDGHDYIDEALSNGASLILVSRKIINKSYSNCPLLMVKDTKKVLSHLARIRINQSRAKFIGITGSLGKTSTKEALKCILSNFGQTETNFASMNDSFHLVFILINLSLNTKFVILEAGMTAKNELREIAELVKFDIVMITTIEAVHLKNFSSLTEIADAKSELLLNMNNNSMVLLNSDNDYFSYLLDQARKNNIKHILSFGQKIQSTYRLIEYIVEGDQSIIIANVKGKPILFRMLCHGVKQAINLVAALGIVDFLGIELGKAITALNLFSPIKGRGERSKFMIDQQEIILIDDSYNASPASVEAALKVLGKDLEDNKKAIKVAILGDMLELGINEVLFHEKLHKHIITNKINHVILVGTIIKCLNKKLPKDILLLHVEKVEDLVDEIEKLIKKIYQQLVTHL